MPPESPTKEIADPTVPPPMPVLTEVYDEHFSFVWRALARLGVKPASLDDACQDVFLVVHRRLTTFDTCGSIKAWLYGIARRVAKDHRRWFARKGGGVLLPDEMGDPSAKNPFEETAKKQASQILQAVLESMDHKKREVFVLSELEQLPATDVAQALDVNLNTVYSRIRSARQQFDQVVARLLAKHHHLERLVQDKENQ